MAEIRSEPTISFSAHFTVSESEARALDALAGYGDDAFVKAFYENLGEAYMKKHEAGLRSFLKSIRQHLSGPLGVMDRARRTLKEKPLL